MNYYRIYYACSLCDVLLPGAAHMSKTQSLPDAMRNDTGKEDDFEASSHFYAFHSRSAINWCAVLKPLVVDTLQGEISSTTTEEMIRVLL
jgi:hypothetical protein